MKLRGLLPLFLLFFVFLCPTVEAYTYPIMSTEQAEYLIETLKKSTDLQNDSLKYSTTDLETILNTINPELLKNQFNNLISQTTYNLSWENIILFTYFDSEGLFWNFMISNNDTNNDMGVFGISKDGNSYYRTINFSNPVKMVTFLTNTNNSLIFRGSYQDMIGLGFYTYTEPIIENDIITNLDRFICFNKNYYTKWNRELDYYFKNKVIFNNNGTIEETGKSYIEENNYESENGIWWNSNNRMDSLYINANHYQWLNDYFYVGIALDFDWNYYYYSGDEKISVNDFIDFSAYHKDPNGNIYHEGIKSDNIKYIPKKDIYLDINAYCYRSGDLVETKSLVENWLAITWTDDILVTNISSSVGGSLVNSSGEVIAEFSGEVDNNNIVDSISNTIENTILGEKDVSGDRHGGLLGGILDGIKGLFIPGDDYFYNEDPDNLGLWQRFNSFFSAKLGFLWDMIIFVPRLLSTIVDLLTSMGDEWSITVPNIDVPDFQGGEVRILESFEWSPYTTIYQDEKIAFVYDLYLDIIDFFVYWGLVFYGVQVYNEVLGNSNTDVE